MEIKKKSEKYKYVLVWIALIVFWGGLISCGTIFAEKGNFNGHLFLYMLSGTFVFSFFILLLIDILECQEKILDTLNSINKK